MKPTRGKYDWCGFSWDDDGTAHLCGAHGEHELHRCEDEDEGCIAAVKVSVGGGRQKPGPKGRQPE